VVGSGVLVLLGLFAALAFVADFVATSYGARRFGASRWGTAGGAIGGLLGALIGALFLGVGAIFGLLIGSIGGVFLGEYLRRQRRSSTNSQVEQPRVRPARGSDDWRRTSRAAGGVLVGYLAGAVAQGVLGLLSVAIFVIALLYD
jgi:uncharacterized protein YqgC (DUF456 family)